MPLLPLGVPEVLSAPASPCTKQEQCQSILCTSHGIVHGLQHMQVVWVEVALKVSVCGCMDG